MADRVLNDHFGGTYTAYLTLTSTDRAWPGCDVFIRELRTLAEARFRTHAPGALDRLLKDLEGVPLPEPSSGSDEPGACIECIRPSIEAVDAALASPWIALSETINYLDPETLTLQQLREVITDPRVAVDDADRNGLLRALDEHADQSGPALQEAALSYCDTYTMRTFSALLSEVEARLGAPAFKRPEVLAFVESLQDHLATMPLVGKTSSAVDALKKAAYELNYLTPSGENDAVVRARNDAFYAIPPTPSAVAQVFTQLEGMKKKDSLFHLVTRDYTGANIWIQLKSGDNQDMEAVVASVQAFLDDHPAPVSLATGWAGLTYINVVWQEKMVVGMLSSLVSSFAVVLVMMVVLFRSLPFGLLAMIPLTVTISLIYGLIGLVGKDYDMPVAVLSALTLGLSVDFAIHFLQRSRELRKRKGCWKAAIVEMFKEPAMAISRNAIIIAIGFTPLLVAPLVPYRTVGFFLATIMAVSWLATLFILAALITALERVLFAIPATASPTTNNEEVDHE